MRLVLLLTVLALDAFAGDFPHESSVQARLVGVSADGTAFAWRIATRFVDDADRGFCKYPDLPELKSPDAVELRVCGPKGACEAFVVYALAKYEEKYVEGGPPLLASTCTAATASKQTLERFKARAKKLGIDLELRPEPLSATFASTLSVPANATTGRKALELKLSTNAKGGLDVTSGASKTKLGSFRAELAADSAIGATVLPARDVLVFWVSNSSGWIVGPPGGRPAELPLSEVK